MNKYKMLYLKKLGINISIGAVIRGEDDVKSIGGEGNGSTMSSAVCQSRGYTYIQIYYIDLLTPRGEVCVCTEHINLL